MTNEQDMLRAAGWRQRHHDTPHEDYVSAYGWTLDGIDWFTEDEALVAVLKAEIERLTKERDAALALAESWPNITAEDANAVDSVSPRYFDARTITAVHRVFAALREHAMEVKP